MNSNELYLLANSSSSITLSEKAKEDILLSNDEISDWMFESLSNNKYPYVRYLVVKHKDCPKNILEKLTHDKFDYVRVEASNILEYGRDYEKTHTSFIEKEYIELERYKYIEGYNYIQYYNINRTTIWIDNDKIIDYLSNKKDDVIPKIDINKLEILVKECFSKYKKEIKSLESRLSNVKFLQNAPATIVNEKKTEFNRTWSSLSSLMLEATIVLEDNSLPVIEYNNYLNKIQEGE